MAFGSPNGSTFLHKVVPSYPALARRLEKEGTVLLCVTIDERGRPVEVEVLGKAGFGFDEEAVKAIKDSTFVPARKEGKPLTCKALLPIRFGAQEIIGRQKLRFVPFQSNTFGSSRYSA